MGRPQKIWGLNMPLNALRAFEASARHLSFTCAAIELSVTPTAVSAQVNKLEECMDIA
jgi:LysR family transcriptional regulator of beta-lactamase